MPNVPGQEQVRSLAGEWEVFQVPQVVVRAYHDRRGRLEGKAGPDQAKTLATLMRALPEGEARKWLAATLQAMDIIRETARLALFACGFEEVYEVAVDEAGFPPLSHSLKAISGTEGHEFVSLETVREMQERSGIMLSLGQAGTIYAVFGQVQRSCREFDKALGRLEELVANLEAWEGYVGSQLEAFLKGEAPVWYNEGRRAALAHVMRNAASPALAE